MKRPDKVGERPKITLVVGKDPTPEEQEAVIENAWRVSGDLHVIADRLALGLLRGEVSPALTWVHKALLDLADASVDLKPYAKLARSRVRYVAVWEGHYRERLSWEKAKEWAAEKLRGTKAEADAETMWAEYKKIRKALRAAGVPDDDPGYRWIDLPDKTPG